LANKLGAGLLVDNLSLSPDGSVVAATFPKALEMSRAAFKNTSITAPAAAHRISINTGHGSYFGEKYKVQRVSHEPI
jgi:arylesterase/paraoxonase